MVRVGCSGCDGVVVGSLVLLCDCGGWSSVVGVVGGVGCSGVVVGDGCVLELLCLHCFQSGTGVCYVLNKGPWQGRNTCKPFAYHNKRSLARLKYP